ncbi:helix-turn-helix transcriptional regulator [Pantoea sp. NPDC088449]|uniref:helix-turn-helix transcriptional regulator n=1 Tax=Pantoea sp. NPDC088449 TaxID=3364392 RepID=UPI003818383B
MIIYSALVRDLQIWIVNHIKDDLNIQSVADRAGYSRYHLQRIFSSECGKPLGVYLRECRLHHAAQDLLITDDSILSVAVKYNFDSQQNFTRTFKKLYNTSPSKWRQKNKKLNYLAYECVFLPEYDDDEL